MSDHIISVTLDPRFSRILEQQAHLQTFLLGIHPIDLESKEKAQYIRDQAFALVAEIVEAVDETHWKPWATPPADGQIVPNLPRFVGELADVYIFLMNLMLMAGVSSSDLSKAVEEKQKKNLNRWINGYDAKKTKCPACRRSYDDPEVKCYPGAVPQEAGSVEILPYCSERERFIDTEGNTL